MTDTVSEFLDAVLPDLPDDVAPPFCVLTEPPAQDIAWPPITERAMRSRLGRADERAFYISTMLARRNEKGEFRNRIADFWGLNMIVLDDVGEKVDPNNLKPTYIIETSEGSFHWGYVLAQPLRDKAKALQVVRAIYEADLSDSGGKLINKFVRLPAGINGKLIGDGRNDFPVRLVELNDRYFTPEQLLEGFGLRLPAVEVEDDAGTVLPREEYQRVKDPVLDWFFEHGYVLEENGGEWVSIKCPWANLHTDPSDTKAGYSPLGRGNRPDHRAFSCFHSHEHKTAELLHWVAEQGGPTAAIWDPIAPLVARYVLLEHSQEVADTWASAGQPYPIVSLSAFKNARREYTLGVRGAKQYFGEQWLEHPDTVRCRGRVYIPEEPPVVLIEDVKHFNSYRAPKHPRVTGTPDAYLEHIAWLIPAEEERELFHDWIAQKLQRPASRSFAVVLVADLPEGKEGKIYGTGRSTVGDILSKVLQAEVAKIDLQDITGRGDSQTAYNDWADGTQMCIIEETKEEAPNWRMDLASYETIKKTIDTRPITGVRVKPKYGRIYKTTLYANFLFFTNHADALQLPEGDRRFAVLECATHWRKKTEYAALQKFLRNDLDIARLFWWYMERDTETFEHIYPPMTPSKQRMIRASVSTLDEAWAGAMEDLPGGLVTVEQLKKACLKQAENDLDVAGKIISMVNAKWRKLPEVMPGWRLETLTGKRVRPRIISKHNEIRDRWLAEDWAWLQAEVAKND